MAGSNDIDDDLDTDLPAEQGSDVLGLSDEEVMKLAMPAAAVDETPAADGAAADGTAQPAKSADGDEDADKDETDTTATKAEDPVDEVKPAADAAAKPDVKPADEAPAVVNHEDFYKKLTAPFKANGKEMKIDNADDAIRLMQMGASYNKKMSALKPSLKVLKLLEQNNLLDEGKLGFLIDLDKKNPEAITKLLKDSKLEPLDLDIRKDSTYTPTVRPVDDREMELDSVLEELKDSPSYTRTLDVVTKKWDAKSMQEVSHAPQLLKVINDHIASGVYDLISTEVEKQRMLGTLSGIADIEAYKKVGDSMDAQGKFAHLFPKAKEDVKAPVLADVIPPKKVADSAALNEKRRAAGGSKGAAPDAGKPEFNPLALSDEEFSKQTNAKFL